MSPRAAAQPPVLNLDDVLADPASRIIVCCGSGGVGKTTTAAALALRAAEHAERVALEKAGRRRLKKLARPTYELPLLPDGVDLGGLYELAEHLCRQGAA